jgi:hypothetical protein
MRYGTDFFAASQKLVNDDVLVALYFFHFLLELLDLLIGRIEPENQKKKGEIEGNNKGKKANGLSECVYGKWNKIGGSRKYESSPLPLVCPLESALFPTSPSTQPRVLEIKELPALSIE